MPSFKLILAYDGNAFVGWQRQAEGPSIQDLVEAALAELDGRPVTVTAAGRTDAGVHALGQAASVTLERSIDAGTVIRATNARLPPSIRVLDASEVPPTFHARHDARGKTYCYRIWNADVLTPFEYGRVWHLPGFLDVGAMALAAPLFEGHQDFAAFQAAGSDSAGTERVVFSSRVRRAEPAPLVLFEITGSGFLRHMVRAMAGTLVEVGSGRRSAEWVRDVLESRNRGRAGPTAPAAGLFLMRVQYE